MVKIFEFLIYYYVQENITRTRVKAKYYVNENIEDIYPLSKYVIAGALEYAPVGMKRCIKVRNAGENEWKLWQKWISYFSGTQFMKMAPGWHSLKVSPENASYDSGLKEVSVEVSVEGSDMGIWKECIPDPYINIYK